MPIKLHKFAWSQDHNKSKKIDASFGKLLEQQPSKSIDGCHVCGCPARHSYTCQGKQKCLGFFITDQSWPFLNSLDQSWPLLTSPDQFWPVLSSLDSWPVLSSPEKICIRFRFKGTLILKFCIRFPLYRNQIYQNSGSGSCWKKTQFVCTLIVK